VRPESAVAALVRARVTHQISTAVTGRGGDAIAVVEEGPLPTGSRLFVPGRLPCGECAACRRALCAACPAARAVLPELGTRRVAVPERFLAPVDDGMPASKAIAAGLVAEIIGAAGRAGLGAGDTAIWMGRQPWARIGASWSVGRGCRTFLWGGPAASSGWEPSEGFPNPPRSLRAASRAALDSASSSPVASAIVLEPGAGPSGWGARIADAEAAGGPVGGRPERRIFLCDDAIELCRAAIALATPGSTVTFLRGAPQTISGLDAAPPLRILTGSADHPDLVPDALAALRRGEIDVDGAFREVPAGDEAPAVAVFLSGGDRPIPVVVYDGTARD
jgi:hypothetical protein